MSNLIGTTVPVDHSWFNEPEFFITDQKLTIKTNPDTDFWQKTHYGFQHDNGHCLLRRVKKDFRMTVKTEFFAKNQYDQCGLIVRVDENNWLKTSVEFESKVHSRLGSVVTNLGYSDWATLDIKNQIHEMWYRIQTKNKMKDYLIEYSRDGNIWSQLRIAHLHKIDSEVSIGIYACSPMQGTFDAQFCQYDIKNSAWI